MNIKVNQTDNHTKVAIFGRLDIITAPEFEAIVRQAIENEKKHVIIDCSELDYISSSGLRVFLMAQKMVLAKQAKLSLCCLKSNIMEIFDISGFSQIFMTYTDLDTAMNS
jgi:anti-anti-sigma factor